METPGTLRKVAFNKRPFLFTILAMSLVACSISKKQFYYFDHQISAAVVVKDMVKDVLPVVIANEEQQPTFYASSDPVVAQKSKVTRKISPTIKQQTDSIPSPEKNAEVKKKKRREAAVAGLFLSVLSFPLIYFGWPVSLVFGTAAMVLSFIGFKSNRKFIAILGFLIGLGVFILSIVAWRLEDLSVGGTSSMGII